MENEMVMTPSDFLIRRSGLLYFNRPLLDEILIPVLHIFKQQLNWSDQTYEQEKAAMEQLMDRTNNFEKA
jgi:glycerol-3-phosphate dehydrogenase